MSEDRLQQECYLWFHNKYPLLRGLLNYNLNNSANVLQGKKNKSMGLQKGRSDLVFYYDGKAYMIEMKTLKGYQSTKQEHWQRLIELAGFEYYIIRTKEQFISTIENILKNS